MKIAQIFTDRKHLIAPVLAIAVTTVSILAFTQFAWASFGSWGDSSLIHACKDDRGVPFLVAPGASCLTNETQVTWLKDVNVASNSGLTISRNSSGATIGFDTADLPVTTARYEEGGTGLASPNNTWQDVPNATVTETFKDGTIKAVFSGSIVMTNGDGTANIRLKVQPTGGSASYVGAASVFRASSPSSSENSNESFVLQKVIDVDAGEYSITPQVLINNASWGVYYENNLIVEQ